MGTCGHFSRSSPSNSWWQTMAGWQVLSRPSAAEGGGRRPAFTGLATRPYSATEVDGWQHKLSRVSQNRAAVHIAARCRHRAHDSVRSGLLDYAFRIVGGLDPHEFVSHYFPMTCSHFDPHQRKRRTEDRFGYKPLMSL